MRVKGHGLRYEGAAFDEHGKYVGRGLREGRGKCSCGEFSPVLYSDSARKRWHREHKEQHKST